MNITTSSVNNNKYKTQKSVLKDKNPNFSTSLNKNSNSNINFEGSLANHFDKFIKKTTYENADKLVGGIDEVLGDKYFSKKLEKAGFKFSQQNNTLEVVNRSVIEDLYKTLRFPLDLGTHAVHGILKQLNKIEPLRPKIEPLLNGDNIINKHLNKMEMEKAKDYVHEVLDVFTDRHKKSINTEKEIKECYEVFKDGVTSRVGAIKKNYNSRDERVLNRIATSIVSAIYSANDFYNISMLQKDDKEEAKKAQSGRFKQEITRMALSAATTFISLGLFDRHTKHNLFLNAAVIAGGSLISEVFSRVISKTPLIPLTPEQAKKYSMKKDKKNNESKEIEQKNNNSQKNISFKNNINNSQNVSEIFKNFAKQDGSFTSLELMNQISEKNNKKKLSFSQILLLASTGASLMYIASAILKGDLNIKFNKQMAGFANKYKDDLAKNNITGDMLKEGNNILHHMADRKNKTSFLGNIKKLITRRKKEINVDNLRKTLEELKAIEGKKPLNEQFASVLDEFLEHIEALEKNEISHNGKLVVSSEMKVLSGLLNGVTKIFKTVYDILSIPGLVIKKVANSAIENSVGKDNLKAFNKVKKQIKYNDASRYKDEIGNLYNLCYKNNIFEGEKRRTNEDILKNLKKRIRNIETGAETGDLANLSRTMVTAIATYFFVNDYTNRVLIESGGKNVQEAKEERRERLAHKASNFVINGTLMNLFNTVFKGPLNNNLLLATLIATATETTNEFLVRKSICQPVLPKDSKQDIIDFEEKQLQRGGIMGAWSKTFRKLTGKKTLVEKAHVDTKSKQ